MMFGNFLYRIALLVIFCNLDIANGLVRKCFSCRSRGELGTCRDPFTYNSTLVSENDGVEAVPCASGWCGKVIEGGERSIFKADDDNGVATQRLCLQRGPSDNEERCAYTEWGHKKVFMCFCVGDLCNGIERIQSPLSLMIFTSLISCFYFR